MIKKCKSTIENKSCIFFSIDFFRILIKGKKTFGVIVLGVFFSGANKIPFELSRNVHVNVNVFTSFLCKNILQMGIGVTTDWDSTEDSGEKQ